MFLPRTICSRKSISGLLIGTFLLDISRQCNDDLILVDSFLIQFTGRLVVDVQVGGVGNELVIINGGWHLYPSTFIALDVSTQIFAFRQCKTIEDKGEETLIVKLDIILADSINFVFILLHQGQ